MERNLVHYQVLVKLDDNTELRQRFELDERDSAGVIREQVAAHLCQEIGNRVDPSQVRLTVEREGKSKRLALSSPIVETDRAHVVAFVLKSGWRKLIAGWDAELKQSILDLCVRPLEETQRTWNSTGEFGEIVMLIDEMLHSATKLREAPEETPRDRVQVLVHAVQTAGAQADSPGMAVRVLEDHFTEMTNRSVPFVNAEGHIVREYAVHAPPEETTSSCIEKLAEKEDVDPSRIRLSADGALVSYLDAPPQGAVAFVSEECWHDLVAQWRRSDRPGVNRVADFIEKLSKRPMPETRDGTWGTAGEFGELVRSIDSLLKTEQRRGGHESDQDIDEIFEVLESCTCTDDPEASPKKVKAIFDKEFG